MEIVSRADAKAAGLTRYFTARPCKKGHIAERYVGNKTCRVCADLLSDKCKRANWPKYIALINAWQKAHPHKLLEYQRIQNRRNPGRRNLWTKNYRSAKDQRMPDWLGPPERFEMESIYVYCGALRSTGLNYHVDHVVPLRGEFVSGLHVPWNLQVIPGSLNMSKGNRYVHSEH